MRYFIYFQLFLVTLIISSCSERIDSLEELDIIMYIQDNYLIVEKEEKVKRLNKNETIDKALRICSYLDTLKNELLIEASLPDPLKVSLTKQEKEAFLKINNLINRLILDKSYSYSGYAIKQKIDDYINDVLKIKPMLNRNFFEPIILEKVYTVDGYVFPWVHVFDSVSFIKVLQKVDELKLKILNIAIQLESVRC